MNYIFGNNTQYPRASRGHSAGPKQKQWAKRSSAEELPSPPSRWQQLLTFFTRRNAFTDCITAGASQRQLHAEEAPGGRGRRRQRSHGVCPASSAHTACSVRVLHCARLQCVQSL
ncbi:hypothetical protein AAFF_G00004110 [Aldrovandia affinis]|uniref:Uncharacterized protein n=1 Tax=Aldrovandia affinis TaxID=143900 RepID=A0AAD7TE32_9TELE|nr:hypothetical protein AAFF_G00004110 [Aldrovandia affinis]